MGDVLLTIDCDMGDVAVGGDGGDGGYGCDEDGCCEGGHFDRSVGYWRVRKGLGIDRGKIDNSWSIRLMVEVHQEDLVINSMPIHNKETTSYISIKVDRNFEEAVGIHP